MAFIKSRKHAVARPWPSVGGAAAATAGLLALALPAAAQTQPRTLKEVTVEDSAIDFKVDESANPKFTAPLLDMPQTIQVIPQNLMREQGATTLTEALRNSPGVGTFFLGENGPTSTGDAIYMRGFDASGSIFVDGVRDLGSITRDVFNIEQVEVIKGPAGTDIGRSSPTGYVNLISKQPTLQDAFSGSIGFGSGNYKRSTVDWNKAITRADGAGMALRLNAAIDDSGVAGRDHVKADRRSFAPSLALGLNTPTRFYFNYLHAEKSGVPDGGVFTLGLPGYQGPEAGRPYLDVAAPVDPSNFYGTRWDFDDVTADMFTARIEHDITSETTLRNITRWGRTRQDYMLTSFFGSSANIVTPLIGNPATWTLARNPVNKNQTNKLFTNQTNLSARFTTGGIGHSLNAGVELIREEQDALGYFAAGANPGAGAPFPTGSWPAANLYNPDRHVSGYRRVPSGTSALGSTDTVSAYVFDTARFDERWQLTGGLRFDHYSTDYRASARSTMANNPRLPVGTLVPTELSAAGDLWSGRLGLVYKPAPDSSIYASYGTSAQPPGGANFALAAAGSGNNASRTDFAPQKATSYELGTKWDVLDKRLALTAALYRNDILNEVVEDPISRVFYQTGKKRVRGIELGAVGTITDRWGISTGFTTMDTKILRGAPLTASGELMLPYTPKNAFTFWNSYLFPFGVTVAGGARYNSKMTRGTGGVGAPTSTAAYWVLDAMASWRVQKNLELQLNVFNLLDEQYVAGINRTGYRYTPGIPRSAQLTANISF